MAFTLGTLYAQGLGLPKDPRAAFERFKVAADAGLAKAEHNVAAALMEGIGVTKDVAAAVEYYERAAAQGFDLSQVLSDSRAAVGWATLSLECGAHCMLVWMESGPVQPRQVAAGRQAGDARLRTGDRAAACRRAAPSNRARLAAGGRSKSPAAAS